MTDENPDLPQDLAARFGSVPPADETTMNAQISAALDAISVTDTGPGAHVIRLRARRRVLAAVAAAAVLLGAGNILLGSRSAEDVPAASANPAATDASTVAPNQTYSKGFIPLPGGPQCTNNTLQVVDSVYIGDYVNPADNRTYLVFTFGGELEFIDKDTCTQVQLSPVTAAP